MCRKIVLIILLLTVVSLSGCGPDSREIDHRSLILGLAIDKGVEQKYSITMQLPILQGAVQDATVNPRGKEFETFTVESDSLWDGLAQLEAYTPTVLFLGHLKVVQISEVVAREGLDNIIDILDREPSVANQIFLVIVEAGKADELIKQESPLVNLPSLYLNIFFQADQKLARSGEVRLFEYRRDSNMISGAATIPMAKLRNGNIVMEDKAVFKDHKMVDKLIDKEAGMSHLLKEDSQDFMNYTIPMQLEGKEILVSITRMALVQDFNYKKSDPVEITLDITGKGELVDLPSDDVNADNDVIKEINQHVNKQIEADILKTINKMKEINVEPWLFGHRIWALSPEYFESLAWEKRGWRDSKFNVNVDFQVVNTGQRGTYDKVKIGR